MKNWKEKPTKWLDKSFRQPMDDKTYRSEALSPPCCIEWYSWVSRRSAPSYTHDPQPQRGTCFLCHLNVCSNGHDLGVGGTVKKLFCQPWYKFTLYNTYIYQNKYTYLYIYVCDNSFYLHKQLHRESMLIMPEKSTWQIAQELRSAPAHSHHQRRLLPAQGAATTCIRMTTASVENRGNPKSSLSNLDIHIVNFRRLLHIIELSTLCTSHWLHSYFMHHQLWDRSCGCKAPLVEVLSLCPLPAQKKPCWPVQ